MDYSDYCLRCGLCRLLHCICKKKIVRSIDDDTNDEDDEPEEAA